MLITFSNILAIVEFQLHSYYKDFIKDLEGKNATVGKNHPLSKHCMCTLKPFAR
jgi:hypothetical protein